ncbi:MAG: hypothetical protein HY302_05260, partial [Opitutae bacterium]|nr:hypothetical protein [Opitutae bacterium]
LSPSPTATFLALPRLAAQNHLRQHWLAAIGGPLRVAMYYAVLAALGVGLLRLAQCLRQRQTTDAFLLGLGAWALFLGAFAVNLLVHITSLDTRYPAMVAAPYCALPLIVIFTAADVRLAWGASLRRVLRPGAPWVLRLRALLVRHGGALLGCGAGGLIFAARLREIHLHAGDVPFLDQWKIEGEEILLPWVKGTLSVADFFRPHHEHVPGWTRLLVWLQTVLTGRWDPPLEMTVNAALFATFAGFLLRWIRRSLSFWSLLPALALLVALGASPHSWENSTWGFQSQFPLALLFLVWHLTGSFDRLPGTGRWWLAQAAGLAGLFTLGSMWAAPLAVVLVLGWTGDWDRRRVLVPAGLAVFGLGLMLWVRAHAPPGGALALAVSGPQQFIAAWLLQLGWPAAWTGACIVLNLPLVALARRTCAQPQTPPFDRALLALGLWSVLQAAAIAYARNGEYSGFVSRYGDLLMVGTVANGLALVRLSTTHRWRWSLLGVAWLFAVGQGLLQLSVHGSAEFFHARSAERARVRRDAVQHYLAGADLRTLAAPEVEAILFPAPEEVGRLLAEPGVRHLLPVAAGPARAGKIARSLHSRWDALALFAAITLAAGLAGIWRAGGSSPPALPDRPDHGSAPLIAGLGLVAGGLIFLWPRPLDFDAARRRERLVAPAGTLPNLGFHFTAPTKYSADRLEGAAGLSPISLRNFFYGTHVDGPDDRVSAATAPFTLTGPFLVVPVAGYPNAPGNELLLRVSDPAGRTLADLRYTGPDPGDLDFWAIDVRPYAGQKARLLLRDNRTGEHAWLAVAPPHFSPDATAADRLRARWQLERSASARGSLAAIAGLCAGWLAWSWFARGRAR